MVTVADTTPALIPAATVQDHGHTELLPAIRIGIVHRASSGTATGKSSAANRQNESS